MQIREETLSLSISVPLLRFKILCHSFASLISCLLSFRVKMYRWEVFGAFAEEPNPRAVMFKEVDVQKGRGSR